MSLLPTQQGDNSPQHESQCRRCGISCHVAVPLAKNPSGHDRAIVIPGMHCRFLQEETPGHFTCGVYENRFTEAPWCHHADVAGPLGYLAQDCPYGTPDRGKVRVGEAEMQRLWPLLWRTIRQWGVPDFVHQPHFLAMLEQRTQQKWQLVAENQQPLPPDLQPSHAHVPRQLRLVPLSQT